MGAWISKLFIEHADIFLKIMNQRWLWAKESAGGMVFLLFFAGWDGSQWPLMEI